MAIIHNNLRQNICIIAALTVLLTAAASIAAYRAPVWSRAGMAATPHPAATAAAIEIFDNGGNAVDATVAAAFALAVVEQYHSGLGGGEFALVYHAESGEVAALDARETAPAAASAGMFVDPATGVDNPERRYQGGLAVGVPGSVAGRVELIKRYGRLTLAQVIAPAVKLAEEGFIVDRSLAVRLKRRWDRFAEQPALVSVFLSSGKPIERGAILKQPALARTLRQIARDGGKSFYRGELAVAIAKSCQDAGGVLTVQDLADYQLKWREPIKFDYRGYTIFSMPPPSSGGVCLAQIFNILEPYPLNYLGAGSAEATHLIASAFDRAFADRAHWLGDPDFSALPVKGLTSPAYADSLRKGIDRHRRIPVTDAGDPWIYEAAGNTSHISAIDKEGNMCALTTSVNTEFGSLVFVPEGGFFLNSTMDDFASTAGAPNKYDLSQGMVNGIKPGKRPLSSMSPTLVLKGDKPFMSLGSVGGPRIITSVAQMLINIIDFGMDVQAAMDAPRVHCQWRPDKLYVEDEVSAETILALRNIGWNPVRDGRWSLSQAVQFDAKTEEFFGASDARGVGTAGPAGDR